MPGTAIVRASGLTHSRLNEAVYQHFPDVQTIAEESTAYPLLVCHFTPVPRDQNSLETLKGFGLMLGVKRSVCVGSTRFASKLQSAPSIEDAL